MRANDALCPDPRPEPRRPARQRRTARRSATRTALRGGDAAIVEKGADVVTLEHPQVGDAYRRTTLTVVRDRAGQPLYLFAQCQDVTPQRLAELELQAERAAVPADGRRGPRLRDLHARPRGADHQLERRRRSAPRAGPPTRSSASTSGSSTRPSSRQARHPEHELELAPARGRLPGGGLAGPQGRQPVLGARHDHRDHRRGRRAHRLRQGHPRPHRADADARAAGPVRRTPWPRPTPGSSRPTPSWRPRRTSRPGSWRSPPTSCGRPVGVLSMSGRLLADSWDRLERRRARGAAGRHAEQRRPGCSGCSATC